MMATNHGDLPCLTYFQKVTSGSLNTSTLNENFVTLHLYKMHYSPADSFLSRPLSKSYEEKFFAFDSGANSDSRHFIRFLLSEKRKRN